MRLVSHDIALDLVDQYRWMLLYLGYELTETSAILDFGCGDGGRVYAFRDAGYNAVGYDIHDYLPLRNEADRKLFFIGGGQNDRSDFTVGWSQFRLPFPDATFDFVFSNEVMEHVQNHEAVLRELARVAKRQSVAIHTFPPKYMWREPHMNVPLGGVFRARWYYWLSALLGIRNQYQRGLAFSHVADLNHKYAQTGVKYLRPREILDLGRRYFSTSRFLPELWWYAHALRWHLPLKRRMVFKTYRLWATYTKWIVWVLEKRP